MDNEKTVAQLIEMVNARDQEIARWRGLAERLQAQADELRSARGEQQPTAAVGWLSSYEEMGDRLLAAGWRPEADAQWDGLRRMHAEYGAPIAQPAPQPEQSGWIVAAERVPSEDDGEVLVLMDDGSCEIAWASYWQVARTGFTGWVFRDPDEDRTTTHWMPLPASPTTSGDSHD